MVVGLAGYTLGGVHSRWAKRHLERSCHRAASTYQAAHHVLWDHLTDSDGPAGLEEISVTFVTKTRTTGTVARAGRFPGWDVCVGYLMRVPVAVMVTVFDWLPTRVMEAISVPFTGMVVFAARAQLMVAEQFLPTATPVQAV